MLGRFSGEAVRWVRFGFISPEKSLQAHRARRSMLASMPRLISSKQAVVTQLREETDRVGP